MATSSGTDQPVGTREHRLKYTKKHHGKKSREKIAENLNVEVGTVEDYERELGLTGGIAGSGESKSTAASPDYLNLDFGSEPVGGRAYDMDDARFILAEVYLTALAEVVEEAEQVGREYITREIVDMVPEEQWPALQEQIHDVQDTLFEWWQRVALHGMDAVNALEADYQSSSPARSCAASIVEHDGGTYEHFHQAVHHALNTARAAFVVASDTDHEPLITALWSELDSRWDFNDANSVFNLAVRNEVATSINEPVEEAQPSMSAREQYQNVATVVLSEFTNDFNDPLRQHSSFLPPDHVQKQYIEPAHNALAAAHTATRGHSTRKVLHLMHGGDDLHSKPIDESRLTELRPLPSLS